MGVREYDYIRGNTAVVPERKVKEKEKNREIKIKEAQKRKHLKRKQIIIETLKGGAVMFLLAATTLFIDGYVYKLQENLTTLEDQMIEEKATYESLKVEMLKFASVDKVKSTAEKELGMVYPNDKSTITIDMSKEYFSHIKDNEESKSSLLAKFVEVFN